LHFLVKWGILGGAPRIRGVRRQREEYDRKSRKRLNERIPVMLYTIAIVLVLLWLLGMVSSYTIGGFIHILLAIAIIVVLLRIISGRKPL
jgi:uncharacterized Tic20 family protein